MTYVPCSVFFPGDRVRAANGTEGVITDLIPPLAEGEAEIRKDDGGFTFVPLAGLMAWEEGGGDRAATRSWNAAIVTTSLTLGAFLFSAIAYTTGWHTGATGRVTGISALALIGCGAWLHLSAARFGPLDPEPEDERPECLYESCHHNHPEAER